MSADSIQVERYFDSHAISFDALYEEDGRLATTLNRRLRRGLYDRVKLALEQIAPIPGKTVLDVGSGSGRISVILAEAGAAKVVGIDFADNMIDLARAYAAQRLVDDRVEFQKGDFADFKESEQFDAVIALGVFDYIREPAPFLRKMAMHAKGRIVASFPGHSFLREPLRRWRYSLRNCPLYFYSRNELERVCADAGLKESRIIPYASSGFLVVGDTA